MRDIVSAIFGYKAPPERYPVLTAQLLRGYRRLHTYAAAGQTGRRRIQHLEKGFAT
jgi:hypothetical protein